MYYFDLCVYTYIYIYIYIYIYAHTHTHTHTHTQREKGNDVNKASERVSISFPSYFSSCNIRFTRTLVSTLQTSALCVNACLFFTAYSSILNMSALSSSETFVNCSKTKRCNIPKDKNLQSHRQRSSNLTSAGQTKQWQTTIRTKRYYGIHRLANDFTRSCINVIISYAMYRHFVDTHQCSVRYSHTKKNNPETSMIA